MAHIYKRGKTWTVRFSKRQKIFNPETNEYESVLKQKSKGGFRTKAEAQKYGIEMESASLSGVDVTQDPLFKDYFTNWYENVKIVGKKENSLKTWGYQKSHILARFGDLKLKDIDAIKYQEFINDLALEHTPQYVQAVHNMLKACITFAVNDGVLTRNFTSNAKIHGNKSREKTIDYLNNTEMQKLIEACLAHIKRSPLSPGPYAVILALNTGMRIGEISALTWNDLDYENGTININKTWYSPTQIIGTPKTKSSIRVIPVNKDILKLLDPLKANKDLTPYILGNPKTGHPYFAAVFGEYLKNTLSKIGINRKGYHFHSLRHSHVAYLLSQGVDIYAISQRLGHSNISITLTTYAYFVDEAKKKEDELILLKLNKLMHK